MTLTKTIQFAIPFMGVEPLADSDVPNNMGGRVYSAVWAYFNMHHDGAPDANPPNLYVLEHKHGKLPITAEMISAHAEWDLEPVKRFVKEHYVAFIAERFNLQGLTLDGYEDSDYTLNVTMPIASIKAFADNFLSGASARENKRCNFDYPLQHYNDEVVTELLRCFTNELDIEHGTYDCVRDNIFTDLICLCMSIMLKHEGEDIDGSWGLHSVLESEFLDDCDYPFSEGVSAAIGEVAESFIDNEWLKKS